MRETLSVGALTRAIAVADDTGSERYLLQRTGGTPGQHAGAGVSLALHRCHCGQQITNVVDCPEVPARLLCSCGAMPFAKEFGMDPDTRFPADYLTAIASAQDCRDFLARERPATLILGSVDVAILASLGSTDARGWQPRMSRPP